MLAPCCVDCPDILSHPILTTKTIKTITCVVCTTKVIAMAVRKSVDAADDAFKYDKREQV